MEQTTTNFEYDAFISYRHIPRDSRIAEKLHKSLETYRTPSYLVKRGFPARLKKVFRDRDELPTSSDLNQDIEDALLKSKFLIVVCSPEAAKSKWVLREIEIFGASRGYDKILALLIEGEPAEAFPNGLIRSLYDGKGDFIKVVEPLAADIRSDSGAASLKLLKTEKLRFLASILGCRFDDLRQREHERKTRRILTLSASIAAFLLAVTVFTLWQLHEVNAARDAAVESEQQALGMQSSLYAALAKDATDSGDELLGISLAMEALPKDLQNPERPLTQEAKDVLYYTSMRFGVQPLTYFYPPIDTANEIAEGCFFNENNGDIVTVGEREIRQFNPATGRLSQDWIASEEDYIVAVSPNADRTVVARYIGDGQINLQLWDLIYNRMVMQLSFDPNYIRKEWELSDYHYYLEEILDVGFGSDNETFFILMPRLANEELLCSDIRLYDAKSGEPLESVRLLSDNMVTNVILNGNQLLAVQDTGEDDTSDICVFDIQTKDLKCRVSCEGSLFVENLRHTVGATTVGITIDGKHLSYVAIDETLHTVDVDTGESRTIATENCSISTDGSLAAYYTKNGQFAVYDIALGKYSSTINNSPILHLPDVSDIRFSFCGNDSYILFEDGEMIDVKQSELNLLPFNEWSIAATDKEGKYFAYLNEFGKGTVVQMKDSRVNESIAPAATMAAINQDGALLFSDQSGRTTTIRRWDATENTITITDQEAMSISHLSEVAGNTVGMESYGVFQKPVLLFSMKTGKLISRFQTSEDLNDFLLDPLGHYMLVSELDNGIFLVDVQTGKLISHLSDRRTSDLALPQMGFFPDGKRCWHTEYDSDFIISDLETGKTVGHLYFPDNSGIIIDDGTRIIVYSFDTLQFWAVDQLATSVCLGDLQGKLLCYNNSVVVTIESPYITNLIHIYDAKTGRQKATIRLPDVRYNGYKGILIGGDKLLTITDSSAERGILAPASEFSPIELMLWDCNTGKALGTLYRDYSLGTDVLAFGLVNDGTEIAIVSTNNDKTYIRTIPFPDSLDQVYDIAKQKLAGRSFQAELDIQS